MNKLFPTDILTRRERVEAALNHQPVDRVPILEQLSYNPRVIAEWTGKTIDGFNYTIDDICCVIRQTVDLAMPAVAPCGTRRYTTDDGFVWQNDNWMSSPVSRPFTDENGARDWLYRQLRELRETPFDTTAARDSYRQQMLYWQQRIDGAVILNFSNTGFCSITCTAMGLELFTYFIVEYADLFDEFMATTAEREVQRIHAIADRNLSPVILIPEDFATKQGPIFSPELLKRFHYPYVKQLADAWHEHDIKVLYHTDGNYRKAVPDLIACGVDGFYCLEANCSMDAVELKNTWPQMVWAGGIDGVDLMERGTPQQVRTEVHRHITQTRALDTGGMFIASSSEINPPIPPENFRAMIDAVAEMRNPRFARHT